MCSQSKMSANWDARTVSLIGASNTHREKRKALLHQHELHYSGGHITRTLVFFTVTSGLHVKLLLRGEATSELASVTSPNEGSSRSMPRCVILLYRPHVVGELITALARSGREGNRKSKAAERAGTWRCNRRIREESPSTWTRAPLMRAKRRVCMQGHAKWCRDMHNLYSIETN